MLLTFSGLVLLFNGRYSIKNRILIYDHYLRNQATLLILVTVPSKFANKLPQFHGWMKINFIIKLLSKFQISLNWPHIFTLNTILQCKRHGDINLVKTIENIPYTLMATSTISKYIGLWDNKCFCTWTLRFHFRKTPIKVIHPLSEYCRHTRLFIQTSLQMFTEN